MENYPIVRAAVAALDAFGALDRPTAAELLTMWCRRPQLLDAEVHAVLAHYPTVDPTVLGYEGRPVSDR